MPVNDPTVPSGDRRTSDPDADWAAYQQRLEEGAERFHSWLDQSNAEIDADPSFPDRSARSTRTPGGGETSRDLFATGIPPKAVARWYKDENESRGSGSHRSRRMVQRIKDADPLTPQMGWG